VPAYVQWYNVCIIVAREFHRLEYGMTVRAVGGVDMVGTVRYCVGVVALVMVDEASEMGERRVVSSFSGG